MKQTAQNTFSDGLNLDLHPIVTPNSVLTDNINGTFITYDGNEFCLQNDRGNIKKATLSPGFIPIGVKERNGILYIASCKKIGTDESGEDIYEGELGTYPGINWNKTEGTIDRDHYTTFCNFIKGEVYAVYSHYDSDEVQGFEYDTDVIGDIIAGYGGLYSKGSAADLFMDRGVDHYAYFSDLSSAGNCCREINQTYPIPEVRPLFEQKTIVIDEHTGIYDDSLKIPFRTTLFNFDPEYPVTIDVQDSYDGSVNLILTDGKNPPRMINSGFSVNGNHYEILARNQSEATNTYNEKSFDLETRLILTTNNIVNVDLKNVQPGGQLKGGNYTFYIKFGDDDYNQTDVVAESGIVSIFKGTDGVPSTISGTLSDERTDKMICLTVEGLNSAYSKIYIYYTREYSDTQGFRMTEAGVLSDPIKMEESTTQDI